MEHVKPILVLCLGNELLSDDGFGPAVCKRLAIEYAADAEVDVVFAPLAGFALLDLLHDRVGVLIVDTIESGAVEPGKIRLFEMGTLTPSRQLTISHQLSLPTALELGRRLGYSLPDRIDVLAVEAVDVYTLSEQLTPAVAAAVVPALERIDTWISDQKHKEGSNDIGRYEQCGWKR